MFKPHQQALQLVANRFKTHPQATLLIALVIGVTLSLPSLFYLGVSHIGKLTNSIQQDNEVTVFLQVDATDNDVKSVELLLKEHAQIKSFRFVSKDIAWQTMQDKLKSSDTLSSDMQLDNPLPHAFYVTGRSNDPSALQSLQQDLDQMPSIDHVLFNNDWSKKLSGFVNMTKKVIYFISVLLCIGLLVIIGNTIRMQIVSHQEEIEVSNLIGATHSFIRLPFLYAGAGYGLLGGLFATLITALSMNRFNRYMTELANLYPDAMAFSNISGGMALLLLITGVALGWLGAYFVVNHTLKTIVSQQSKR